ncbi:MAG: sulfate reduction electron transfer complex DsrMKJOP subunit DsrO [Thermodesulfobacteriota bacterium]
MAIDRRDFLKVAGLTTVIGLTGGGLELLRPGDLDASAPGHEPAAAPGAKQWGMLVDMSRKENWQACIEACHNLHNVPSIDDKKEEIKWIWQAPFQEVFPGSESAYMSDVMKARQFMVLCNHCAEPACVRVCPTKATFKRPEDGIVMMDMHRCIGCRFCMAGCPYGARSFNWREPRLDALTLKGGRKINLEYPTRERGVVEKCTFCAERVDEGKQPACVEATRNGGLVFGDLNDPHSEIRQLLRVKSTIRRKPEVGTNPSIFYVV